MAFVRVEKRNAHVAGLVKLQFVNGRDGKVAKATLTAISNTRRGSGEARGDEVTVIQWKLWGKQAENAAEYLGKGSHVNIVGRLRNNNYTDGEGADVFALKFTAEEIDYLDSKADSEARRARQGAWQVQREADAPEVARSERLTKRPDEGAGDGLLATAGGTLERAASVRSSLE